ncbi:T9SS type A sorting domain-containing protein [Sporocytophaga myxococcoides]|uniref:T9SS type A sorting domain-containing protein n=1 Tax=Sporocytophaga myxococcoides TaxID=153721 RepID=UPI00040819AE|nr:T9SS type A sorting domain-containing protein [Sporocytophaga myxococcoides]
MNRSYGQWTDGQPAANVLGQPTFTTSNPIATESGLNRPNQVVVDPVSGKIFVADAFSHRVLRYPSTAAYIDGANAEAVFGQTNLSNAFVTATSTTSLNTPSGIALDDNGNLWIADQGNNRVVRVSNAVTALTGSAFDLVLGQSGFSGSNGGTGLAEFSSPWALTYRNNALWVSDFGNNRILKFDNPSFLSNGAPASLYLGTGSPGLSDNTLNGPGQISIDVNGNLWVADVNNNRVLRFSNANALSSSADADLVIGQSDFFTSTAGLSQSALSSPWGVYMDEGGRLYIADNGNDRVLIFNSTSLAANGALADHVIGQIDFANSNTATAQDKVSPIFVSVENDLLFVSDFSNNRVLIFKPSTPLPVNLLNFSAISNIREGKVLLQWYTVNEIDFSRFEVEQSYDEINFDKYAGQLAAKGGATNTYRLEVPVFNYESAYFRLKLIDNDGSVSYSNVISVKGEQQELLTYPNPFRDKLEVELSSATGNISVYDNSGKEIKREVIYSDEVTLDLKVLPIGEYWVKVQTDKNILIKKVLKID